MKTEVKKLDGIKRQISVEVTGDIVKNKFEDVFKKINQTAKVPGFRPGTIPRDILEKKFSAQAHELVLEELLPELYNKAVEKEFLEAVGNPKISDVKIDRVNLSFKAEIEVAPEISLKKYRGVAVNYKKIEVPLDEVKRNIDTLKEQKKIENVDDSLAKGLGYPNLAALEKFVETQLFIQKQNQERRRIEDEIIDSILKDLDFGIPQVMVDRHLQELIRQVKLDMAIKGVPREKIEEQEKALAQDLAPEARKQVKVYLVLAEIARKENIVKDEHLPAKVMEFLLKEAEWKESK